MHMHSLQSIIQITEQWLRDVIHHENTLKKKTGYPNAGAWTYMIHKIKQKLSGSTGTVCSLIGQRTFLTSLLMYEGSWYHRTPVVIVNN